MAVKTTTHLAPLAAACELAESFRGATSPNPPVGAAGLDFEGRILSVQAHAKAGDAHAEAKVLRDLRDRGCLEQLDTMLVTLEPCNHFGRTPPCSEALLAVPSLKRVAYAVSDPNPKAMGGAEKLRNAGIFVENLSVTLPDHPTVIRARELLAPFSHWVRTGLPWVTVKTAWRQGDDDRLTMLPPTGRKTFTSESSLKLAHELRKRADALITGSGTVLADQPELTVRHVPDHPGKSRWLAVMDRRSRVPGDWLARKEKQGFRPLKADDFRSVLTTLGAQGVLEALVEAGPTLSGWVLENGLWNEHHRFVHRDGNDQHERQVNGTIH